VLFQNPQLSSPFIGRTPIIQLIRDSRIIGPHGHNLVFRHRGPTAARPAPASHPERLPHPPAQRLASLDNRNQVYLRPPGRIVATSRVVRDEVAAQAAVLGSALGLVVLTIGLSAKLDHQNCTVIVSSAFVSASAEPEPLHLWRATPQVELSSGSEFSVICSPEQSDEA
jgi:hypothetical protein